MKICATVTWYNPIESDIDNIRSYVNFVNKVYIVDNSEGENINLYEKIKNLPVEYIPNLKNMGIAYAQNIACKKALQDGYEWILLMDQDSVFKTDCFQKYLLKIESLANKDEKIGMFAPFINEIQEKLGYVKSVVSSGSIISLNAWKAARGFNEPLFIDEVDFEMCYKLIKMDYKIFVISEGCLLHKLGNMQVRTILNHKLVILNHVPIRKYYIFRNRLFMIKKYRYRVLNYTFQMIRDFMYIIFFENKKQIKIYYVLAGINDCIHGKMGAYAHSINK